MPRNVFIFCCIFTLCIAWMFIRQNDQLLSGYPIRSWFPRQSVEAGPWQSQGKYCYRNDSSVIVFLHLTNNSVHWTPIEECAFKLAAIHNNETGVCVLTAFPVERSPMLSLLAANLEINRLNITALFYDTPLYNWYEKYTVNNETRSEIWLWELSDALRYAYLFKYGGKYMDTDSWTLRNLASLNNVAGWQDDTIANGVLFFEAGHPLIASILANFTKYFSSGTWGSSGPDLITAIHNSGQIDNRTYEIVPVHYFYPTYYSETHWSFESNLTNLLKDRLNNSFALHLWGRIISNHYKKPPQNGSFVAEMLSTVCSHENSTM